MPRTNAQQCKLYREKFPEKIKQIARDNYLKHREERLEYRRLYRLRNKESIAIKDEKYRKNNPLKYAQYAKTYKNKWNLTFGRPIQEWSVKIRDRDDQKCQICGGKAQESHHIFYQNLYPELRFNLNNGIALCHDCHFETHGRFKNW